MSSLRVFAFVAVPAGAGAIAGSLAWWLATGFGWPAVPRSPVLWAGVGAVVGIVWGLYRLRARRRRHADRESLARTLGWTTVPSPDRDLRLRFTRWAGGRERTELAHVVVRAVDDAFFGMADVADEMRPGTWLVCASPRLTLPDVRVFPRTLKNRIFARLMGTSPAALGDASFDRRFLVTATDRDAAARLLTATVARRLADHPGLELRTTEDRFVVHVPRERCGTEDEVRAWLELVADLFAQFAGGSARPVDGPERDPGPERPLLEPATERLVEQTARASGFLGFAFLGIGTLLVVAGIVWFARVAAFGASAETVVGTVVDRVRDREDASARAVVSYVVDGTERTVVEDISSAPPTFALGESATVAYDPADPARARIETFREVYFPPTMFVSVGLVFAAIGWFTSRDARTMKHRVERHARRQRRRRDRLGDRLRGRRRS